jgi:peroxiredoxin
LAHKLKAMNLNKTIIITAALAITSLSTIAQGFKITGKTTGINDSTWLYLRTATPEKNIDSSMVIDGRFKLSGRIGEKATRVYLYTPGYTNYVGFWLENKLMTIAIKAGEFKKGIITGSATEDEDRALYKAKATITNREDSLSNTLERTRAMLKAAREADKQFDITYVKDHPQSLIAANLLDIYASTWGKETTASLYKKLSPEMKSTKYGEHISNYISLNKNVKVGDKYVDFELPDTGGKPVKLSDIKSKYILLEFWSSLCAPCRESNPDLIKTYNAYKGKGFAILGVSLDENKNYWLKAVKDDQLPWQNISDLKGDQNRAGLIYGISAVPSNFLIDESGTIIAKDLRGDDLNNKLKNLLD